MAEMLLLNPRRRRKSAKRATHRAAPRRAKRATYRRRRNPITAASHSPVRRVRRVRRHAAHHVTRRRRRNPIGGSSRGGSSIMGMLKTALIGGAGAVTMDVLMGQVNPMLPASLQTQASTVGAGDAVKAGLTILLGRVLRKPTKGLSEKMAVGALTCQVHDIIAVNLPSTMALGFFSPAQVIDSSARVGPNRVITRHAVRRAGMGAYMNQGGTPLLSAYQQPGPSPLLSGGAGVAAREGVRYR